VAVAQGQQIQMVDPVLAVTLSTCPEHKHFIQPERVLLVKVMMDIHQAVLSELQPRMVAVVVQEPLLLAEMVAQVQITLLGLRLVAILPAVAVALMELPVLAVEAMEHPTRQVPMELPTQVVAVVEPQQEAELTMAAMVAQE